MKVWTENDMEPVIKVIDEEIRHPYRSGARTRLLMIDLYHAITRSGRESDDLTIYGYRVGDLVPLAWALRKKGVQAEEIEDWNRELRQMKETVLVMMNEEQTDAIRAAVQGLAESVWEE